MLLIIYGIKQTYSNSTWQKSQLTTKLKIFSLIKNSNNSIFYKIIKTTFGLEKYLTDTPKSLLHYMIKFRARNYKLPIEVGNWSRIAVSNSTCNCCNNKLEDELFEFNLFLDDRKS